MPKTSDTISSAEIQKLLSDPKYRIQLHNLVHNETEKVYKILGSWGAQINGGIEEVAKKRIDEAEQATENLRKIFSYGCYFGLEDQNGLWSKSLNRLGTLPHSNGSVFLIDLQTYPALLVLYAGGLGSLAGGKYYNLKAVLDSKLKTVTHGQQPLVLKANCTLLGQYGNQLLDLERKKTPLSDHLNELFKENTPKEVVYKEDFDQLFDKWEILLAMTVADFLKERPMGAWAPVGAFSWRDQYGDDSSLKLVESEIDNNDKEWDLLKAGLFGGSVARAKEAIGTVKEIAGKVAFF